MATREHALIIPHGESPLTKLAGYVVKLNNCEQISSPCPNGTHPYTDLQSQHMQDALSWAESSSGPPHQAEWTVVCKISGEEKAKAVASQKGVAKEEAARNTLIALGQEV
ncbi:hypothetical protein OE88DRAFT_1730002 [Heliocybe sulcata]|uniref:DRBM domain-containing protein n=1 Tax=Heliocybe sulcata TaxID=5364 RepID=A0A5C3NI70_9AGAM|nr:hypothetical protein OE88DRAFT_1730002 [Heliocybe sulcata]